MRGRNDQENVILHKVSSLVSVREEAERNLPTIDEGLPTQFLSFIEPVRGVMTAFLDIICTVIGCKLIRTLIDKCLHHMGRAGSLHTS